MAKMQNIAGARFFVVQKDEVSPAYLEVRDATPEEISAYRRDIVRAHEGNQGVYLDKEHAAKSQLVQYGFVLSLVVAAHGFDVGTDAEQLLSWDTDRERVWGLVEPALKDLFRRTIISINMPDAPAEFENAAVIASRKRPNS